jgi:DNA mismatch endonuclease (patch repair protein)
MTEGVDPARSAQMALIRSKNTKPEIRVRKALHAAGLRYRLHDKRLPGKPDLVFPGRGVAVFVNGCFFHQHTGCPRARLPKSRRDFWEAKLRGNVERDRRKHAELAAAGWTVLVIWECQTEKPDRLEQLRREIICHVASPDMQKANRA